MRRLFLLLLSILNVSLLVAGPIDLGKAQEKAIQFMNQQISREGGRQSAPLRPQNLRLAQQVSTEKGQPAYYVFNLDDDGFIIVSGNDLATPILGYSSKGSFDVENIPDGLKALLKNFESQITYAYSHEGTRMRRINADWDEIPMMLQTTWDQGRPYNSLCPIDPNTGERSITGCVSVAVSQLMYYHQWPPTGNGRVSYTWQGQTLSANLSQVHFEWDKMKLHYSYNDIDEDNAVATLLYHCALACHADFTSSSTGASCSTSTLHDYFSYQDKMMRLSLDETTIDDFEAVIYNELINSRPVLFRAASDTTSHLMVIDGFQNGYFHINFGWGGSRDGYFPLTVIITSQIYHTWQSIIYNIEPDREMPTVSHLYPDSSYVLSEDGATLIQWLGPETEIDMSADIAFKDVSLIKAHAFSGNDSVTSIIFPNNTETIEANAVENCRNLLSVFIPQSVSQIGTPAFIQCPYLDRIVVSNNSYYFESKDGLLINSNNNSVIACSNGISGKVTIPDGINKICSYAFADKQITSIDIPESVTLIDEGAFMGCNLLTMVTLSQGVNRIGSKAFKGCTGLKKLVVHSITPPTVSSDAFTGIDYSSVLLCVPSESLDSYQNASIWKKFTAIVGMVQPEAKKLVVYTKDGAMTSFLLREQPFIRNLGPELEISTSTATISFDINHLKKMMFFEESEDPSLYAEVAYAVYKDGTLTFYYDDHRSSREGTVYDMNTGSNWAGWHKHNEDITKVVFDASFANARPTSTCGWFSSMNNLTTIEGIEHLNTSNVTTMAYMFYHCSAIPSIDLSHFNTSNCTDMNNMFYYCYQVTSLDLSNFNTSNVTNMSSMFENCFHLESLDISSFNTSSVTTMRSMFDSCYPLSSLDVSHFNTSNCTDMGWMFNDCYNLTSLDVTHFNTSKVTKMDYMFGMCSGLTSIDVSSFNTSNCTNLDGMFYDCSHLTRLDVSNLNTSKCSSVNEMFKYNSRLKELRISSTMSNLNEDACEDVGYWDDPCRLIAPEGFDFGVDTSGDYFVWKSGYFKIGSSIFAIEPNEVRMKIGETQNVELIAGHGDYTISNNQPDVVNATLDGEKIAITAIGCGVATITVTDNKTQQVATVEVIVTAPSTIKVEPTYIDFYKIPLGTSRTNYFTVSNTGAGTLTFHLDYSTKGGIFNVLEDEEGREYVLEAGESKQFTITCTIPEDYEYYGGGIALYIRSDATNADEYNVIMVNFSIGEPDTEMPYAVYNDGTLTFYYDDQKNYREGTTYQLNIEDSDPGWEIGHSDDITRVIFDSSFAEARPTTTYKWFCGMLNLTTIEGIEHLNTSAVTNMAFMFDLCINLTAVDVSHFNTSNVTDMSYMFFYCHSLASLDVSHFNTSNVTDMNAMFSTCLHLTHLDVSNFHTSNVTDMSGMFQQCENLKMLDISNFDLSNCENTSHMLRYCRQLISLSVSSSMESLDEAACDGIAYPSLPCTLVTPEGFDYGVDTSGDYFVWKSGYFRNPEVPAEAIDLGLPSGTKWASYNLGTTLPEKFGDRYAWGELNPKTNFSWDNYIYYDGSTGTCLDLGSCISGTEYDVAHVKWGDKWQMPTNEQFVELATHCEFIHTTLNGVPGAQITGKNGNSIFMPSNSTDWWGTYWSGTSSSEKEAYMMQLDHGAANIYSSQRYWCGTIRPVQPSDDGGVIEVMNFSQLPPNSHIDIFDIQGRLIKSIVVNDGSQALVLSDLDTGIYLVRVNGVTYKIYKK